MGYKYSETNGIKFSAIACVDKEYHIGKGNELLFHIPEDMKFFKETTTGHIIVYGRKTLESFPHKMPLPDRTNIVLTSNPESIDKIIGLDGTITKYKIALTSSMDPDNTFYCYKFCNKNTILYTASSVIGVINLIKIITPIGYKDEVFICGGESVYNQFIDYCTFCYLTHTNITIPDADRSFSSLNIDYYPDCAFIPVERLSNGTFTYENDYVKIDDASFRICKYARRSEKR